MSVALIGILFYFGIGVYSFPFTTRWKNQTNPKPADYLGSRQLSHAQTGQIVQPLDPYLR